MTEAEKSTALTLMLNSNNDSDVAVFAITDYWTFDGHIKFMVFIAREGLESQNNKTDRPWIGMIG